jgi:hypothetical protein
MLDNDIASSLLSGHGASRLGASLEKHPPPPKSSFPAGIGAISKNASETLPNVRFTLDAPLFNCSRVLLAATRLPSQLLIF